MCNLFSYILLGRNIEEVKYFKVLLFFILKKEKGKGFKKKLEKDIMFYFINKKWYFIIVHS